MKTLFYPQLAWDSIRKNQRVYVPYILTGGVMVMMYYILRFLMILFATEPMSGGSVLMTILPLGCAVIALFSLLFLFYTNSFLIRQRYREFGLYNILGMDKRNLSFLIVWETMYTAVIAIGSGLICGIALSKAAELVLLNLLNLDINFTLRLDVGSMQQTVRVYGLIYILLLISSLIQVRRSKPLELMQRSKIGEKTLKCNWLFAAAGVILIGIAYYLAVRIEEPVTALSLFFVAVVMVIVGTYLLFISGSVAFCKLLQKNKKYYYQPNHFVSVSSMVYRMKRNGAGLASICILLTMVLVMLSSTTTLYFGEKDAIKNRYPNGINLKIDYDSIVDIQDESLDPLREQIAAYAPEGTDLTGTRYALTVGQFTDDGIILDYTHVKNINYDKVGYLFVISIEDYNRMMGENQVLAADECMLYSIRLSTQWDTFTMEYGSTYKVTERLTEFREDGAALAMTMPSAYLVVADVETFAEPVMELKNDSGDSMIEYEWICGFDCETPEEELAAYDNVQKTIQQYLADKSVRYWNVESRENEHTGFFEVYGSLFFLGIMLSVVFLIAAVLIIYYKQISEGYEDRSRFEIMQKVGMTKKDIRKSIHSQMLTVFFMPLAVAGLHLGFAFPFISKILLMFAFNDQILNACVTLVCFVIFGLLYTIVYKFTSGSYYAIVSSRTKS